MSFTFLGLFGQTRQTFRSVDVNEFEEAVNDTSYVLDVRTPEEYAEGHPTTCLFTVKNAVQNICKAVAPM